MVKPEVDLQKPEVVVYFGLLLDKLKVGVAESEKRIAAIFLLPVWPPEPPGRSFFAIFWPALSLYRTWTARNSFNKKSGCTKSKSVAQNYSSETGSTFKSARNVVKLTVIRKASVKSRRGQTWSGFAKPEVVVYFGLLLDKLKVGVAESEKRVAAIFLLPVWPLEPPGGSFLPYSGRYCRLITQRRLEMPSIRKPGAPNLNLWHGSTIQKPEVVSKVPEMVRNVVELIVIRKTRVKNRQSGMLSQKNVSPPYFYFRFGF